MSHRRNLALKELPIYNGKVVRSRLSADSSFPAILWTLVKVVVEMDVFTGRPSFPVQGCL